MKKIIYPVFLILFVLLLSEASLRLLGYLPYQPPEIGNKIISKPTPIFRADPVYGYAYNRESMEVTLNGVLTYPLTIDPETGARVNPYAPKDTVNAIPEIHIFGCSFFAGFGVNDSQVVSSWLQLLAQDQFRVVNAWNLVRMVQKSPVLIDQEKLGSLSRMNVIKSDHQLAGTRF